MSAIHFNGSTPLWANRISEWIRRYLLADLTATVTGLLGVYFATKAGADLIAVAYIGTIAEAVGYYGPLFINDYREQRGLDTIAVNHAAVNHAAVNHAAVNHTGALRRTVRNLVVEFGVAELFDSGLIRPAVMAICLTLIPNLGIATYVGMSIADIFFYGFAIVGYELRKRFLPNPSVQQNGEKTVGPQPTSRLVDSTLVDSTLVDSGPTTTIKLEQSMALSVMTSVTQQIKQRQLAMPVTKCIPKPVTETQFAVQDETITAAPRYEPYDEQCDAATVRLDTPILPPILGHLVRVTDDTSLSQQLPIYQLPTENGESRKIHIGRHSKRNTVVIMAMVTDSSKQSCQVSKT